MGDLQPIAQIRRGLAGLRFVQGAVFVEAVAQAPHVASEMPQHVGQLLPFLFETGEFFFEMDEDHRSIPFLPVGVMPRRGLAPVFAGVVAPCRQTKKRPPGSPRGRLPISSSMHERYQRASEKSR
ncbi:hypothetical protein CEW88_06405 [Alloyangia pacifica]|uniref:Uncharacterized protein n=1 Tax=Alloyangia pacifica TaxID=311180 RepID=A0A2U8HBN7_9RHOB|nr:hypothetical protein CEW88_06405 [Alloyangia pacifica]